MTKLSKLLLVSLFALTATWLTLPAASAGPRLG
jgi:hypothetical protein